jgi:hypothetical protein
MAGATYPNGVSVPMVAASQEFGAPRAGIPPRPFFRGMISEKSKEWPSALAGLLKNHNAKDALTLTGEAIAGQLKESIAKYDKGPPLKPATIKRKGFDKQLIDTGHMMNSITYKVE